MKENEFLQSIMDKDADAEPMTEQAVIVHSISTGAITNVFTSDGEPFERDEFGAYHKYVSYSSIAGKSCKYKISVTPLFTKEQYQNR